MMLPPEELHLWQLVAGRFRLGRRSVHGPSHWLMVRRNGLFIARRQHADEEVIRLFSVFHDSCRENEYDDPHHGRRGAKLAMEFRAAGHFATDDARMELLVTACKIHNGAGPQPDPTIGACLDADRLDLGRVGITPDCRKLSTTTARDIASRAAWHELEN